MNQSVAQEPVPLLAVVGHPRIIAEFGEQVLIRKTHQGNSSRDDDYDGIYRHATKLVLCLYLCRE